MNELFSDAKAIILALLGALVAVLTWVSKRLHDRVDDHLDDHDEKYIRREDFDRTIRQWNNDRREKHQENVETLARIERKIDTNEERSAKTRHDIRDTVQDLTTQVAVLTSRLNNGRDQQ